VIGVISDVHSNLEALEAVIDDLKNRHVNEIFCVGDIVGYGANPNECCDIIRQLEIPCVLGNHDFAAVTGKLVDWFQPSARESLKWTSEKLTRENKIFLAELPRRLIVKTDGVKLGLVHGSPWDELFEYVRPTTSESVLKKFLKEMKCNVLALGHTHLPFAKKVKTGIAFNPGSVGQPRDGNWMASYALLNTEEMKVKIVRVKYDVETAAMKIKSAGLPAFLWERLYEGA